MVCGSASRTCCRHHVGHRYLRTSIVYALGYLAATGSARLERIRNAMQTPLYTRATAMINRWGAYAVPLCF